jgi:hypothetical protein
MKAVPNMARARARWDGANRSAIKELEGGWPAASPAPMNIRAMASCRTLVTKPVIAVIRLQKAKPTAMMYFRFHRSAAQAMGNPTSV